MFKLKCKRSAIKHAGCFASYSSTVCNKIVSSSKSAAYDNSAERAVYGVL